MLGVNISFHVLNYDKEDWIKSLIFILEFVFGFSGWRPFGGLGIRGQPSQHLCPIHADNNY